MCRAAANIRSLWALWLLVLVLIGPSAVAQRKGELLRGITFCSGVVSYQADKPLLDFVKANRINLVCIDFFMLNFSYDRTDFRKITRFVKKLKKLKVRILADYRTCTSEVGKPFKGKLQPDLCLSAPTVRARLAGWGVHILDKVPGIEMLTIYNPLPHFERNKSCPKCTKSTPTKLLQVFFAEWSKAIKKKHPKIKLGAVFPPNANTYRAIDKSLDFYSPFCSLIAPKGSKECGPGVMEKLARTMRPLKKKPIIPLVKLYWKQTTRNSTADILHCMDEAKKAKLAGFHLWYWSLINGDVAKQQKFKLPVYDLKKIGEKYLELAGKRKRKRRR